MILFEIQGCTVLADLHTKAVIACTQPGLNMSPALAVCGPGCSRSLISPQKLEPDPLTCQMNEPLAPVFIRPPFSKLKLNRLPCFFRPLPFSPPPRRLSTSTSPRRPGGEGSQHRDHSAAGGGALRARGLLVPVCGLELGGDHQEPQSPRPHRL